MDITQYILMSRETKSYNKADYVIHYNSLKFVHIKILKPSEYQIYKGAKCNAQ